MADQELMGILKQGVEIWNQWKEINGETVVDFSEADLSGFSLYSINFSKVNLSRANLKKVNLVEADLSRANLSDAIFDEADLRGANLFGADFSRANLFEADLSSAHLRETIFAGANLRKAHFQKAYCLKTDFSKADLRHAELSDAFLNDVDFSGANIAGAFLINADLRRSNLNHANLRGVFLNGADLSGAKLISANLNGANLSGVNFYWADLSEADLSDADLTHANLIKANIMNAVISRSKIYGVNVWDLEGDFKDQKDLIITPFEESIITVDNIKVAQFIYLILNNKEIRDVINTLTSKTVLILGRFSIPERKAILDALRNKFREYNLLPIVFDFDRPIDRNFTETVQTLAGLSYFVVADVTNPKSSPLELQATMPDFLVPCVPIIQEGEEPFAMIEGLQQRPWVLSTISYDSLDTLINILKLHIIDPAIKKRDELRIEKAKIPTIISGRDLLNK